MSDEPTFFRGRRLSVYCKGGRLIKNAKTGVRYWRLKLGLTLGDGDAHACNGAILSNYQHIQARTNSAGRIEIDGCVSLVATCYDGSGADDPRTIELEGCFLDRFAMTWADGMTEFWLSLEHENTEALHKWVRSYAFSRFFIEFLPKQRSLTDIAVDITKRDLTQVLLSRLAQSKSKDKVN